MQSSFDQVTAAIDRDRAASLGISAQQIEQALASSFGSQQISTIYTSSAQYEVILELVGAPNLPENLNALATGGRIAVIGISAGAKAEVNLGLLMAKRARVHGSTLRARPLEEKALTARAMERSVLPLFEAGTLRVPRSAKNTCTAARLSTVVFAPLTSLSS